MKYNDVLTWLLQVFPHATFGEDNDGQLVIYTDMRLSGDDILPFEDDESMEDDDNNEPFDQ